MKSLVSTIAVALTLAGCAGVGGPMPTFTEVRTLAGDGQPGAVDGAAANANVRMWAIEHGLPGAVNGLNARLNRPHGLAYAQDGSLYFADRGNHQVRVLRPDGTVSTVAGTGKAGFADGTARAAQFNEPIAVATDRQGNVFVADRNNHRIRRIWPDGHVTTLAGSGEAGFVEGPAHQARFNQPYGVALDDAEVTLYVADYLNHAIRQINLLTDEVSTLAGNGKAGFTDGTGEKAAFNQPYNLRSDGHGGLIVPDQNNHAIRRVGMDGTVVTLAGSGKAGLADGKGRSAAFNNPTGVAPLPNGATVVADRNNTRLRLVAPDGAVTTLAGSEAGFADGSLADARFNQPLDVIFDGGRSRLLVSEDKGHRLRVLPKDAPR